MKKSKYDIKDKKSLLMEWLRYKLKSIKEGIEFNVLIKVDDNNKLFVLDEDFEFRDINQNYDFNYRFLDLRF